MRQARKISRGMIPNCSGLGERVYSNYHRSVLVVSASPSESEIDRNGAASYGLAWRQLRLPRRKQDNRRRQ